MTRAGWLVVNTGPCPQCRARADVSCVDGHHWCAACGVDRGGCDKTPTINPTTSPRW